MSTSPLRGLDASLGAPLALTGVVVACWLAVSWVLSVRDRSGGGERANDGGAPGPGPVRTALAVLGATGLVATATSPATWTATAAPVPGAPQPGTTGTGPRAGHGPVPAVAPAPVADRHDPLPAAPEPRTPTPSLWPLGVEHRTSRTPAVIGLTTVVVRRGDTLWSLAAASLGPSATAADISTTVRECHRLNAVVIGPDPDLILPGQLLRVPTRSTAPTPATTR